MSAPLPPKVNLTLFKFSYWIEKSPIFPLTSFVQGIVNAAPNLREVTLPWGFCPDFANSKHLSSLTIGLTTLRALDVVGFNPADLSHTLDQVSDQLVTLCFEENNHIPGAFGSEAWTLAELPRRMPKLKKFQNVAIDIFPYNDVLQDLDRMPVLETLVIGKTVKPGTCLHQILQKIIDSKRVFVGVRNLKILELQDPQLLEGLKTTFPSLESLLLKTFFHGVGDRMKLGVVLKACGGWKGLKHLDLRLPVSNRAETFRVFTELLEGRELYKGEVLNLCIFAD